MFTEKDLSQLENWGISQDNAQWQISMFKSGIEPIELVAPADLHKGITIIDDINYYVDIYKSTEIDITKFVPASGAASRMFKALFEFLDECKKNECVDIEKNRVVYEFFSNIKKFAFYSDLDNLLKDEGGIERLIARKKFALILDSLLNPKALAYSKLPKGLLKFHFYAGNIGRTPFEEHLVEGARYAKSSNNKVNLHFTVSPEHIELFLKLKDKIVNKYEDMYRVKYDISFSVQKSSTDTIAVNPNNTIFYKDNGDILFRPGGHGALIENLNELDSEIIFIKNIDNVVPEKKLEQSVLQKQALAGLLIEIRNKVFKLSKNLLENPSPSLIEEARNFIVQKLYVSDKCITDSSENVDVKKILERLNRPIRVCGMVKNEGEPGGGPFLTKDKDGCISPQVVESSQIDINNPEQTEIFKSANYFNPVDLVCCVKDFNGNKFDLKKFIDKNTCFISEKSLNGKELKALELPGLWNGAMAGWNTIFVEVSVSTFNPVKTVNDLLRDSHQ